MSKSMSVPEREAAVIEFMKQHPDGTSTASILTAVGISKSECMTVIGRMKSQGTILCNGSRGKDRWIYKPKEEMPKANSIWQFADIISMQMRAA